MKPGDLSGTWTGVAPGQNRADYSAAVGQSHLLGIMGHGKPFCHFLGTERKEQYDSI